MNWKSFLSATAAVAMTACVANAQPSITVEGVANGGNVDWTVSFTPDGSELSSIAINLALEVNGELVGAPTLLNTPAIYQENLFGTDIIVPGFDPYDVTNNVDGTADGISEGITFYDEATAAVSTNPMSGTVDAFFAGLGSTDFGVGGPFTFPLAALSFSTVGSSGTVFYDYRIDQGGGASSGGFTVTDGDMAEVVGGLKGDSNGDGVVNTLDIDAFVLALTNPAQYAIDFPAVDFLANNDIDMSGAVNTLDIDPFVALLTGPVSAAPEPATLGLLLGLFGLSGCVRRRV